MDGHYSEDEANQQNITKHIEHSQSDKGNFSIVVNLNSQEGICSQDIFLLLLTQVSIQRREEISFTTSHARPHYM